MLSLSGLMAWNFLFCDIIGEFEVQRHSVSLIEIDVWTCLSRMEMPTSLSSCPSHRRLSRLVHIDFDTVGWISSDLDHVSITLWCALFRAIYLSGQWINLLRLERKESLQYLLLEQGLQQYSNESLSFLQLTFMLLKTVCIGVNRLQFFNCTPVWGILVIDYQFRKISHTTQVRFLIYAMTVESWSVACMSLGGRIFFKDSNVKTGGLNANSQCIYLACSCVVSWLYIFHRLMLYHNRFIYERGFEMAQASQPYGRHRRPRKCSSWK